MQGGSGAETRVVCACIAVCIVLVNLAHAGARLQYSLCVCVCVPVTALVGTSHALRPQVRYQLKVLDARNETNVGISLSTLSSKVMTDFNSLTTVRLALTPQIRYQKGAGAVKTRLVGQALRLVLARLPFIISMVLETTVSL